MSAVPWAYWQRITGWQAALLLVQLSRLDEQIETRQRNAKFLADKLSSNDLISLPVVDERVTSHGYYLFLLRLNRDKCPGINKQDFVDALVAEGVPCAAGYPYPLFENRLFDDHKYNKTDCPEAERMCEDTFWLSHEIMLAGPDEVVDVVSAIEKVIDGLGQFDQ